MEATEIIDLFAFLSFQSTLLLLCTRLCMISFLFYTFPGDFEPIALLFSPFLNFLLLLYKKFSKFSPENTCLFLFLDPIFSFLAEVSPPIT